VAIGAATVGFIVTVGLYSGLTRTPAPVDVVRVQGPAPDFSLPYVGDTSVSFRLSGLIRGRPAVLNFFGAWCPPCRQELPLLAGAARSSGRRVAFVGVDLEDQLGPARRLLATAGVSYPAGFDPDDKVANLYRLGGTPTTVFIDTRGRVVGKVDGELSRARLDWWLARIIPSGR